MTAKRKDEKQSLRTRAESQIEGELVDTSQFNELSSKSLVELVHELQVHQVELEIQNEELRRAQADLQNSRQRFADLFHRAPVGYLVLDGKGLVQDVNETFCNMTGRAPHLVRQQPVFNLIAEKDRSWFMARYKALYKKPDQKNMELSLLVEQGELLPVSLNAVLYAPASEGDSSSGSRLLVTLTDISERKRVEKTLHLQAAMLQNVAEGINLVGLDDGLIQYTNSRFETMFGYEPGEMLGEDIAIVNAPDIQSPKMTRDAIKAALERDGEWHGEVQNIRKDGTVFWCYANVSRFDHPDFGSSVISVHTDITDRKNAEHALQEQTELLATVFENSPNILMLVNADGRVEKINRAGSELSTSPREELLGLLGGEIFQCVNSFDGEGCGRNPECGNCPVRTRMMRSLRAGEMILNEEGSLTVRKESQEIVRDFLISTVPVTVAGQVKVLVTIVDITERKQAEDYMRRQAFLLENVSDAIISTDANFAIQTWNRAAEEIYGWKESEVLGKAVEDVLRSEFKEPLKKILENFYQEGIWRGETVQYHKDGSPLSVLSSVRLIQDEESNLIQAIANNRDISERKRTEEALKRYLSALETLYENAVTISRLQEPKEVAQKIVDALVRYLSWHHVTVRLRRGESDELELVAFEQPGLSKQNRDRIAKKFAEMVNVVGQGLSGWAMQSGKLIRAANVREYPQFAETHPGIQSGMYAPLQVGERVIGVISVESETLNAFSEHDERLLAALAAQAAVAFDNARLYRDLQKELQERSRIEDALRQSEMQNRTILQTALDGF